MRHPDRRAFSIMATAIGWEEVSSAAAAIWMISRSDVVFASGTMLVTCGRPSVNVPVLSMINVSASASISR